MMLADIHIMVGRIVRLDDPSDKDLCTISRITHDLGGGFFLATRINRDGAETSAHVISLAMLAVHEGAELFASYEAAMDATGRSPDTSKRPSLN